MNYKAMPKPEQSRPSRPRKAADLQESPPAKTPGTLRSVAEARLKEMPALPQAEVVADPKRLQHELHVHQIELEMQNAELRRKQVELETALEQFTELYDYAPAGYLTIRPNGYIQQANLAVASLLGLKRAKLLDRRFEAFVAPEARVAFADLLTRAFETKALQVGEVQLVVAGKPPLTVKLQVHVPGEGQVSRVVLTDITELKRAEMALRGAHWRLESIIEGAQVGTWEWNVQTGETAFNQVWAQIAGYTLDELAPITIHTWETLVHPDDLKQSDELLARHFAGELPHYDCECRMRHKHGHWVWVRDRGRVITRTGDGEPLMVFGTHTDITELKRVEAELYQLSARLLHLRDEERRHIARELHDGIGQNLAALTMNLSVLGRVARRIPSEVRQALLDLQALTDQTAKEVRTFSYLLHPPLLDELGLGGALPDYVSGFASRSGIRVDLELARDFPRLPQAIELALFRIVQESLANIHKHSGSHSARITFKHAAGEVCLQVCDVGHGFVVGAGVSNKPTPTPGVGISGMRERLREVGGLLEISSSRGGTIVRATLPFASPASGSSPMSSAILMRGKDEG